MNNRVITALVSHLKVVELWQLDDLLMNEAIWAGTLEVDAVERSNKDKSQKEVGLGTDKVFLRLERISSRW